MQPIVSCRQITLSQNILACFRRLIYSVITWVWCITIKMSDINVILFISLNINTAYTVLLLLQLILLLIWIFTGYWTEINTKKKLTKTCKTGAFGRLLGFSKISCKQETTIMRSQPTQKYV